MSTGEGLPASAGLTRNGLPYNRLGDGARTAVVFPGLGFENKPMGRMRARFTAGFYKCLRPDHTIYVVGRREELPRGCTIADMADDYARTIADEFSGPVDVIGISTGGSIALQFGADHSELVRRLVIHSAAYKLGPRGKDAQLRVRDLAQEGKWREASAVLVGLLLKPNWYRGIALRLGSTMMALGAPGDPSDLIATIEAEDAFDLHDRLAEISVPTLIIAGAQDPFYTEELFRQTAQRIPGAKLVLYPDKGHAPKGAQFACELRSFLLGD